MWCVKDFEFCLKIACLDLLWKQHGQNNSTFRKVKVLFKNSTIDMSDNRFSHRVLLHGDSDLYHAIWHLIYSGNFQVLWSSCGVTGRVFLNQFPHVLEIQVRDSLIDLNADILHFSVPCGSKPCIYQKCLITWNIVISYKSQCPFLDLFHILELFRIGKVPNKLGSG